MANLILKYELKSIINFTNNQLVFSVKISDQYVDDMHSTIKSHEQTVNIRNQNNQTI